LLLSKGDKINMGKYQQFVTNGKKTIGLFALKGLLYGFACHMGGHKVQAPPKPPCATTVGAASSSSSVPHGAYEVEGKATLKQIGISHDVVAPTGANQMIKAAGIYNDISRYYKHNMVISVLSATAKFHSEQNVELRSADAVVPWELEMLKGKVHKHVRLTMYMTIAVKYYDNYGIECGWRPTKVCIASARVQCSDCYVDMLWGLCFALFRQHSARNLTFTHGYPRRFQLLLDETSRADFIVELEKDIQYSTEFADIESPWAMKIQRRSVFMRKDVQQLQFCLFIENNIATARLP
jgi:hypothetical protein